MAYAFCIGNEDRKLRQKAIMAYHIGFICILPTFLLRGVENSLDHITNPFCRI